MIEAKRRRLYWTEIPVTDLNRANAFYEMLLEAPLTEDDGGSQRILLLPDLGSEAFIGHLYEGKPVSEGDGITVHLAVDGNLENVMERIKKAGGEVISPVITIPSGSFFYAKDPDGNSLGIFK
ncbi:VOC family protein [Parasphingorhabdus sp.]|uniref:VOC family protein n=1 Tax=Parasphingorhabdus sp. TaxID=2709688 RepID=UPI002F95DBEE